MTSLLISTSGAALVTGGSGLKGQAPVFPAQSAALEWTVNAGAIDAVANRIVPLGGNCRVYSVTIGGIDYPIDWETGYSDIPFTFGSCDYTLRVGEWGFCELSYDVADIANLPADDTTATIATITAYSLTYYLADIISPVYSSVDIVLNGESTGGGGDTVPPVVSSVSPAGTGVALNTTIQVNFSEPIQAGTGNFYVYNATTQTLVQTIPVGSVSISTNQASITTSGQANSTAYSVRWDAGVIEDLASNPVAAQADDTYSWVTVSAGGGTINPDVDVTVSTVAALQAQLASWNSNWNGTTPAGKTNGDSRVVGINAITTGAMNLSGYNFPQRVYVRHVGTFTGSAAGVASCSVYHEGTGTLSNCTNIWLYLMDLRAPNNGVFNLGLWQIDNTTDCGVVRCVGKGWPFTINTSASGTTSYLFNATGSTRLTLLYNCGYYFGDGLCKLFGAHTNLRREGQMGNYYGGDDITMGVGVQIVDPIWRCNFYARQRMMQAGNHNDGVQFNKNLSGSNTPATRFVSEYDVFIRGRWGGSALNNPSESGWGAYWTADSTRACVGPHRHSHCLFINGHVRATTGFPGGNLTVDYCTAAQHDNDQPPNAGWPSIQGTSTGTGNFSTSRNGSNPPSFVGTNGLLLVLGGNSNGTGANFNLLLPYFTTIPTNYTDLWDIRPPSGAATHPNFGGNKIGCWGLWQKLFNGDSDIVLTKVGWPVAPLFAADFDSGDNFWGSYTGSFDANGDNA